MEYRVRKYLTPRQVYRRDSTLSDLTTMDDQIKTKRSPLRLGLNLAPPVARLSAFKNRRTASMSSTGGPTIKTSAYESTQAGKPPIMGRAPIKGNGPVKLQTNRRLSSGELLITQQANDRTLSEIRNGEYTVGRKQPSRLSNAAKNLAAASLPNLPENTLSSPRESTSLPLTPLSKDVSGFEKGLGGDCFRGRSEVRDWNPTAPPNLPAAPFRTRSVPSSRYGSENHYDADSNALMQALHRAENTRLAAIYAEDDPMDSLTQDDLDHSVRDNVQHFETGARRSGRETPYLEGSFAASDPVNGMHMTPDSLITDGSSLHSSAEFSLMSSERCNSNSTHRTSLQTEVPNNLDDVRRMVDDMRTTYLSAIESRSRASSPRSSPRISQDRFSSPVNLQNGTHGPHSSPDILRQAGVFAAPRKQYDSTKSRKKRSAVGKGEYDQTHNSQSNDKLSMAHTSDNNNIPRLPSTQSSIRASRHPKAPRQVHVPLLNSPDLIPAISSADPLPRSSAVSTPKPISHPLSLNSDVPSAESRRNSLKRADSLTLGSLLEPGRLAGDSPLSKRALRSSRSGGRPIPDRDTIRAFIRAEPVVGDDAPDFI
ncbi:MAG: hypothetical protein Q9227_007419 [Pyrenula ochraceoflavens]